MYLKALEIQGFKSFPDKTILRFGEDITAIVGPNGSGKSNISDAICWVMGEQSVRSLRGSRMEDVIFGGTQQRGSVGFAQVTLVLDNSGGMFPSLDSSEVMVTRRYYRSGESEYYINKQSVRLRDINELFMDTGLGREGYSIIGQGRIDEILSLRSADRREIFEEAAGISRFRHRKEEAQRRLERTEENLTRIGDKISELELQVVPLREQAEEAKKYLLLRDELRTLEISVWLEKLEELRAAALRFQAACIAAKERQEDAAAQLEALYQENERFSQRMQESDLEQETVRAQASALEAQASDRESAAAVLESTVRHSRESIALLEQEMADQDSRSQSISEQMDRQRALVEELTARSARLEEELEALLEEARAASESAGSAAAAAQALQAQEALAAAAAADARERLAALAAGLEQMEERQRALAREFAAAGAQQESAGEEVSAARSALTEAEEEARSVGNVIQGHTLRMAGREKKAEDAARLLQALTMEENNLSSRIRLLTEMEREYEGFNQAVRLVMQCAGKGTLRGIHGPAANLMKAPSRCAVALETALGAGMQNIVVDREEDAKAAISLLKQRNGGRATFLPLTAIRGEELREQGVEDEPGFVGIASALITYDRRYDQIFRSLLGRTVVVEDLDCGIAMARRHQNRFRIVTLDGQIINRGGSMTGGSASRNAGVLSRAAELEKLHGRSAEMQERLEAVKREEEQVQRDLSAARYDLETAEGQRRQAEDEVLRLEGAKNHFDILLKSLGGNLENLTGELESLTGHLEENRQRKDRAEQTVAQQEAEAAKYREQAGQALSGQSELLAQSSALSEEVTARKEELAALTAERDAALQRSADLRRLAAELTGDRRQKEETLGNYQEAIEKAQAEIARRREDMGALNQRRQSCQERLSALNEEKMALEARRTAQNKASQEMNENLLNLERSASRLEQKLATSGMEEKQIIDRLWEHYELSHSDAQAQRIELESVPKAARRIGELKKGIAALGTPNIGAIEEYERVNTRYTYLTDQRDDVEKAKGELETIIGGITGEMTRIFAEQFQLLNESFQATFLEMFGGGQAQLELEDETDILNCGIEIKAQPPGKTLKTISLLSGGEKAFVAIALYFSILKVPPTPFCVMDEIEAALDDVNVTRYARYMRALTGKTQFIVITHRRGTMEEADVLYGVTMQEKGVSKVLTINLNDMAKELDIQ